MAQLETQAAQLEKAMFTPPHSPLLRPNTHNPSYRIDTSLAAVRPPPPKSSTKWITARRTQWAVIIIPLALTLITLSCQYLVHPVAFDLLSNPPPVTHWSQLFQWKTHSHHHRRVPQNPSSSISFPSTSLSSASSNSASPTAWASMSAPATTTTAASTQLLPPIPTAPPPLPTPFPQPLDTSLQRNFTATSCYDFFVNMTTTAAFRACRPFSLLLQTSAAFINAQSNITLLNSIVWGTCNPTAGIAQCTSNMGWFAQNLKTSCKQELSGDNVMVANTLLGLQSYELMYTAGCLPDPVTSSYCYIEAVFNQIPSDLFFYQLPLGIGLPNSTRLTCSACPKSLMSLYAASLAANGTAGGNTGLAETYENAAKIADSGCGADYAKNVSAARRVGMVGGVLLGAVMVALMALIM